jgi:hypothetical protein
VPWRLLCGHTREGSKIRHGGNGGKQEVAVAPHCWLIFKKIMKMPLR